VTSSPRRRAAVADSAARDVELLIGHSRDEYSLLAAQLPDTDEAGVGVLIDGLSPTPGVHRYRATYPSATPEQLREVALSDWLYRMPALHLADAADLGRARVWLYELCWGFGPRGASHGLDTLLLFGTADTDGEVTTAGPAAVAATEQLSRLIRAEHLAFATTGDPGWTRFRTPQRTTRVYRPEAVLAAYPEERSRTLERSAFRGPGRQDLAQLARQEAEDNGVAPPAFEWHV
jgi:para-nitrobenzyl esterase